MTHRFVAALVSCLLAVLLPRVLDACPQSTLDCGNSTGLHTSDPLAEFDCSTASDTGVVGFDIPHGTAHASCTSLVQRILSAKPDDQYTLSGTPAGVPIRLMVVVDGDVQVRRPASDPNAVVGNGYAGVWLDSLGIDSPLDSWGVTGQQGVDHYTGQASIAIVFVPGAPKEIGFASSTISENLAHLAATAHLHFDGLPPGATITSCNGFRQDQAVPALPVSWGRVKAVYR